MINFGQHYDLAIRIYRCRFWFSTALAVVFFSKKLNYTYIKTNILSFNTSKEASKNHLFQTNQIFELTFVDQFVKLLNVWPKNCFEDTHSTSNTKNNFSSPLILPKKWRKNLTSILPTFHRALTDLDKLNLVKFAFGGLV